MLAEGIQVRLLGKFFQRLIELKGSFALFHTCLLPALDVMMFGAIVTRRAEAVLVAAPQKRTGTRV